MIAIAKSLLLSGYLNCMNEQVNTFKVNNHRKSLNIPNLILVSYILMNKFFNGLLELILVVNK